MGKALMLRIIAIASLRVMGAILKQTSFMTSAKMPPSPNRIAGPNSGSWVTPTMTSVPPLTMAWTSTPSIGAPGLWHPALATISEKASRTACASRTPTLTPPASVL
jgi:hypothetical protein